MNNFNDEVCTLCKFSYINKNGEYKCDQNCPLNIDDYDSDINTY